MQVCVEDIVIIIINYTFIINIVLNIMLWGFDMA